jgi:hypothetical protein
MVIMQVLEMVIKVTTEEGSCHPGALEKQQMNPWR